jgi:tRNA (guanine-N7-)-methyltransferase
LWRGSKTVQEKNMKNVAFIRNKVEFLTSFFAENEISEIWITFPDPQIKKMKKRLTSARFLKIYSQILVRDGVIHLKTDSMPMHEFTKEMIELNKLETLFVSDDLYKTENPGEAGQIKTFYEKKFLEEGLKITYLKFSLNEKTEFLNPEND